MAKSICIVGPIGDFGGREIEAGFIANALSESANVTILTTINCGKTSQIFDFIDRNQFLNLYSLIYEKFFYFKFLAFLSYGKARFKNKPHYYVNNSLSKKTGFHQSAKLVLLNTIKSYDFIFICAQLSSTYMKEIVEYGFKHNIPVVYRTSNTIKESDSQYKEWLEKVSMFIHHSTSNAKRLNFLNNTSFSIIDQCCVEENELLKLKPINTFNKLLFIGRLSEEKGILELIDFCIRDNTICLEIIGEGSLSQMVIEKIKLCDNINLLGFQKQKSIIQYIQNTDAVIIPSYEESGPLVGLEAMAAARIIISTKVGAMKERLHGLENQFWFSINDYNSFASLIIEIKKLKKDKLFEISHNNRMRYCQNYSKSIISEQYKNIVKSLL